MLGSHFILVSQLMKLLEAFTCRLYGRHASMSINDIRYQQFCARAVQSSQLPLTQDALLQHMLRANYQAAIWRRSLVPKPDIPSPHDFGWVVNESSISVKWMTVLPAPQALLAMISCHCTTGCKTQRCSCRGSSLQCTDVCGCGPSCSNKEEEEDGTDDVTIGEHLDSDDSDAEGSY